MKKILFFIMFFVSLFAAVDAVAADDAVKILDKASAKFKASGDVKIGFTASVSGNAVSGTIYLSGSKFQCQTPAIISWFDGKTMWNYVAANEEVNVSYPNSKELARMNPYSYLTMYKKGFKCSMGKSTASYYEIVLNNTGSNAYSHITLRLDKKSYQPLSIKMVASKSTTDITVNSYVTKQKFPASTFTFNKKKYPNAEVIDLR